MQNYFYWAEKTALIAPKALQVHLIAGEVPPKAGLKLTPAGLLAGFPHEVQLGADAQRPNRDLGPRTNGRGRDEAFGI